MEEGEYYFRAEKETKIGIYIMHTFFHYSFRTSKIEYKLPFSLHYLFI